MDFPKVFSPLREAIGLMWQRFLETGAPTEPPNADRERAKEWAARAFAEYLIEHMDELKRLEAMGRAEINQKNGS